uniref:Uncharacterized protein n=1 Tax=Panagrolaimus sp. ES5 TaxID=591445 RepID=A0AC34G5B5_9BILA
MLVLFLLAFGVCNDAIFGLTTNNHKVSSLESLKPASIQNGYNFCTEISVTTYSDIGFGTCFASSNLILHAQNNVSYLRVSNVTGTFSLDNLPLVSIQYVTSNIWDIVYNLSMPYEFLLDKEDPYVEIDGTFAESIYSNAYGGSVALIYADGRTFSNIDGTYFDETNPCRTIVEKPYSYLNETICCTKLSPAPSPPSNISKCKKFRSRSTIYNADFSIHATSAMNYTLINNQFITAGNYDNTTDLVRVIYEFNNGFILRCNSDHSPGLKCNVSLPTGDLKVIISMTFVLPKVGIPLPKIGKLIIQNGQTLMEEGVPFSPDNECWYTQHNALHGEKVGTSEFCCKEFE